MTFGKAARRRREELGLSRKAVLDVLKAKDITMALISLRRIEADERQPRVDEALALAEIYQTTVEQLATPNPFDVLAQISEQQEKLNQRLNSYAQLDADIAELINYIEQQHELNKESLQRYAEVSEKFQQLRVTARELSTRTDHTAFKLAKIKRRKKTQ